MLCPEVLMSQVSGRTQISVEAKPMWNSKLHEHFPSLGTGTWFIATEHDVSLGLSHRPSGPGLPRAIARPGRGLVILPPFKANSSGVSLCLFFSATGSPHNGNKNKPFYPLDLFDL